MSKCKPELLYIRSTDKNKYVCLKINNRQQLFILNQEAINDSEFDKLKNQNKTAFKCNNELIHNMYDSQDMFYKSAIYDKSKSIRDGTTYDFKNVFSHNLSTSLTSIIQVNNILYTYEKISQYGHIEISVDSYSYLAEKDNGSVKLPNKIIETYTYNIDVISDLIDYSIDSEHNEKPESGTEIKDTLRGIEYNTLFEIPGTIQNDYDSGNIAANSFKGKNHLNSLFDMDHDEQFILKNAREYIGLGKCNNQIFLKYYDNINYSLGINNTIELMKSNQSNNSTIPQIETFAYISRYANLNGHKSNLYSLRINSQILDKNNINIKNEILEKIKNNIKVQVRAIVEKIQPAHAQLFNIYL